jgi:hypothetical protein
MKRDDRVEAIASLQHYYHISVEMKYQFAEIWKGPLPTDTKIVWSRSQTLQGIYGYMYMSLWLAFINTVAEGWEKIELKDDAIDSLLSSNFRKILKVFRHTVFHFQKNYWAKMAEKHLENQDFLKWATNLDNEFEQWLIGNSSSTPASGSS